MISSKPNYFANKGPSSQSYSFSSSHIQMWELDYKEGWTSKNWCFWIVVLEKTLESSLDCKEIKSVNPKGNQSWIFRGETDAEVKAPILWPCDAKSWHIGKNSDAGKDWRQEEKGMMEDEMTGWHHQLNGHEFEQAPGDGEGQGDLVCCSPWVCKDSDTEQPKNNHGKESTCNARDSSPIPGLRRSLREENTIHSSILAWEIPWTEEPGGLQSMGSQESDMT